jgi:hypothetical protein
MASYALDAINSSLQSYRYLNEMLGNVARSTLGWLMAAPGLHAGHGDYTLPLHCTHTLHFLVLDLLHASACLTTAACPPAAALLAIICSPSASTCSSPLSSLLTLPLLALL